MNITPRGDHTWLLRWQAGRDPQTGKYRRVNETFHGNKKQAETRWVKRQEELERGVGVEDSWTFAQLWARWLEHKQTRCRASTMNNYQYLGRVHILPYWGTRRVDKLRPPDVHALIQHWQSADARKNQGTGLLSARTIRYLRQTVVNVLDLAVKWQMIPTNVAALVTAPPATRPHHQWWTLAEGQRFLDATRTDQYYVAFALALGTGLRKGEILALRWQDIDWTAQTLTIAQTVMRTDSGYIMGPPKTPESRRTIALDAPLLRTLERHRTIQRRDQLHLGPDYTDHGLVIQTRVGTPLGPRNLHRAFAQALTRVEVPPIRFHDMRHTHASWLLAAGVDMRTIADRLGHSQVSFTMQIYAHSDITAQRDPIHALGTALFSTRNL